MARYIPVKTTNYLTGTMIKECIIFEEHFAALLEGELTWGEKTAMQRHVEECPYCRQELLAMKRHWDLIELMSTTKVTPPKPSAFKQFIRRLLKIIWPPA